MSCYEGMNGHGLVTRTDLHKLQIELTEAFNRQIQHLNAKQLKKLNLKKANTRTRQFRFLTGSGDRLIDEGYVNLDLRTGEFYFYIMENNHAVDCVCQDSEVYKRLSRFMTAIPVKGTKYGAQTYYWSEFTLDENDIPNGTYTRYGGWMTPKEREASKAFA
jgi:hypothetical protein